MWLFLEVLNVPTQLFLFLSPLLCVGLFLFKHTWTPNPISIYDYHQICFFVLDTDWYSALGFVLECGMSWIMTYKMRIKVDATLGAMCINFCGPPYLSLLSLTFLGPSECGMDVIKNGGLFSVKDLTDHYCQWKKLQTGQKFSLELLLT